MSILLGIIAAKEKNQDHLHPFYAPASLEPRAAKLLLYLLLLWGVNMKRSFSSSWTWATRGSNPKSTRGKEFLNVTLSVRPLRISGTLSHKQNRQLAVSVLRRFVMSLRGAIYNGIKNAHICHRNRPCCSRAQIRRYSQWQAPVQQITLLLNVKYRTDLVIITYFCAYSVELETGELRRNTLRKPSVITHSRLIFQTNLNQTASSPIFYF